MGKLFIVPTPIGNLEDITFRAVRILKEASFILAEDSRQTKKLLAKYEIEKKIVPHHTRNEHKTLKNILLHLKGGEQIALVTDAGTPAISDPGFLLVRACINENIEIECLPGPTAFVPALVNSGLPSHNFCFEGFLPHKKGRQKRLKELTQEKRTMIFYESPYRLLKTLSQFAEFYGEERNVSVSRELSKIYEETYRGSLAEVIKYFSSKPVKGELVIILEGQQK
ncbi:MAG TPA: 16S rRNA (cytidine(1402)-2'-O)-methyltransferase [Flavobacteriales bacterium]|nr:16S rRNA (cytidine(1402)-2'-O)-methyltransferase [Flavobacteriales bacterium]HIN40048.1 16S rRNA (cytidine(1402)-2'-O)-methyltransferase [Flavobacteriales bacterium]